MVEKRDQELKFVIGRVNMQILEGVQLEVLFLSRTQTRKGKSLAEGYFIASPQSEAVVLSKERTTEACLQKALLEYCFDKNGQVSEAKDRAS